MPLLTAKPLQTSACRSGDGLKVLVSRRLTPPSHQTNILTLKAPSTAAEGALVVLFLVEY